MILHEKPSHKSVFTRLLFRWPQLSGIQTLNNGKHAEILDCSSFELKSVSSHLLGNAVVLHRRVFNFSHEKTKNQQPANSCFSALLPHSMQMKHHTLQLRKLKRLNKIKIGHIETFLN
jgi:hypothetical protein